MEVISTGTDSPELCTPDTTPPAQTPDLSPILSSPSSPPCSPPTHRTRNACFMRQSAVDEQGGAEIQVLVEGRGMDNTRGGANSWTTDAYPHRRGSKGESSRSTTPSLLEEEIGHINGHEQNSSTHHPWENGSSNHKPIEHMASDKVRDQMSTGQKPWKHVSLNPKSRERTISREREWEHTASNHIDCDSSKFKPQVHIYSNHKSVGHTLSNHKTNEHASSNHKPKEFISSHDKPHVSYHYNPPEHVSSYHKQHEHVHSNHKPRKSFTNHAPGESNAHQPPDRGANNSALGWTVENNSQWMASHSHLQETEGENDYRVEMRFQPSDSVSQQNFGSGTKCSSLQGHNLQRLRQRNHDGKEWGLSARESSMDSVQMLDTLNVGVDVEEWPLHRDITLSPPLTSYPEGLEQDVEHLNLIKTNSVSQMFPFMYCII